MNPHLWLHERGIDKMLKQLQVAPTTELVDKALSLEKEVPTIELFTHLYEPKAPSTSR